MKTKKTYCRVIYLVINLKIFAKPFSLTFQGLRNYYGQILFRAGISTVKNGYKKCHLSLLEGITMHLQLTFFTNSNTKNGKKKQCAFETKV